MNLDERFTSFILVGLSVLLTGYCVFVTLTEDLTLKTVMYQMAAINAALVAIWLRPKS